MDSQGPGITLKASSPSSPRSNSLQGVRFTTESDSQETEIAQCWPEKDQLAVGSLADMSTAKTRVENQRQRTVQRANARPILPWRCPCPAGRQNESASAVSSPAEAELVRHRLRIQGPVPSNHQTDPYITVEVVVAGVPRGSIMLCSSTRVRLLTALTASCAPVPAKRGPAHRGADQTQTWSWHSEARGRIGSQTIGGPGGGTAKLRDWRDGVRGASGLPLHNLGRALAPRGPSAGCGGIPGKTGASPDRRRGPCPFVFRCHGREGNRTR